MVLIVLKVHSRVVVVELRVRNDVDSLGRWLQS